MSWFLCQCLKKIAYQLSWLLCLCTGDPVIPGIHLLPGSQATMNDGLEVPESQEAVIAEHSSDSSSDSSSSSEESSDTSDDSSSDEDEEEEEEEGMGDDDLCIDRPKPSQEGKEYGRHPLTINEEGTSTMIENVSLAAVFKSACLCICGVVIN